MQQKPASRPAGSFSPVAAGGLSYSCSPCGGRERSRTHREDLHHRPPDPLTPGPSGGGTSRGPSRGPSRGTSRETSRGQSLPGPPGQRSLLRRRRTQSVGVGTQDEEKEEEDGQEEEDEEEEDAGKKEEGLSRILFLSLPSPPRPRPPPDPGPDPDPRPPPGSGFAGLEAAVRGRLAVLLRAADSSMQRRLARVSWQLAQTDTELLCERAHWQLLARERQQAAERQRSLSRQVDVAVMVIAALREQLNASENRLEQREREALSIQSFLAAAARQEASGRLRVQRFIETLLERIALAERLVQFYQEAYYQRDRPPTRTHTQVHTHTGTHTQVHSHTAGGQPYSGLHDNRSPTSSSSSRPSLDQDQGWVWEPRLRCRSLGYEV
ncbi:unnamed protein product [Lota lota]